MKTVYKPAVKFAVAAAAAFPAVSSIQALATVLVHTKPTGDHILTPIASGVTAYSNEKATLDVFNVSEGYIMVKYTGNVDKIKVQITKSGSETYTYNLNGSGVYEVSSLSEGSGSYSVKVFENIQGSQYPQTFSQGINTSITNQFGSFLHPNQHANFNAASTTMQTDASVAASATDQLNAVSNVYNYIINSATYDTVKASLARSGYLPNADVVLAQKKDICFDYTALMTVMFRSQDIPAKLVVGYTENLYHAWVNVYLEDQGWVDNIIYLDGNSWKLMDPTFAPSSGQSQEIMRYIGNGSNYRAKYSY